MTKRTFRSRLDAMARKVDSFRVGRTIPQNLYGRDEPDQTVSLVTDRLKSADDPGTTAPSMPPPCDGPVGP